MRHFYNEKFDEIERKTGVKAPTAQRIWQRAQESAESNDFHDLLAVLDPRDRTGRPSRVVDGTNESKLIRSILYEETNKTFKEAAEDYGIELSRSTLERIAHDHRDTEHPRAIVRAAQSLKPLLTLDTMEWRWDYAGWALEKLDKGAIFVFSDEDYHNFGGAPHKKQRITRMEGEPSELYAEQRQTVQFSFMHWGACCVDIEIPMPMHIWEAQTPNDKKADDAALMAENNLLREQAQNQQSRARQPGTEEYRVLTETNANIRDFNKRKRDGGDTSRKGIKIQKKPEQIWKYEAVTRDEGKGGIDWFRYRKEVLMPKLYSYYKAIQQKHPDREVWLVEDNAGGHKKASDIMAKYREEHNISKAPHPPNSPDLNMIEGLWDYEQDRVEEYPVFGGSQADVQRAKDYVTREWERAGPKAKQLCESFRSRLELCRKFQGDNNWRG